MIIDRPNKLSAEILDVVESRTKTKTSTIHQNGVKYALQTYACKIRVVDDQVNLSEMSIDFVNGIIPILTINYCGQTFVFKYTDSKTFILEANDNEM